MADTIFNNFIDKFGEKVFDMSNDVFKIILLNDTYTINEDEINYGDILSTEELATAGGYTVGGVTLTSVTWEADSGTNTFDAANVSWPAATLTARYAIIYDDTVTDDPVVCLIDFGENKSASAVTFEIRFNDDGIFTLAQGA